MTFLKYIFITLLTIVLIAVAGLVVASSGIKSEPGYAKLSLPSWSLRNTVVAVNVGPIGLKPVRWIVQRIVDDSGEDLELAERVLLGVMQDIDGVQLRVYEVHNDRAQYDKAIEKSVATLKQKAWHTVVKVHDGDERVVVMHSEADGVISGVTVMVSTPEEAVFINLLGRFDPQEIARYAESVY